MYREAQGARRPAVDEEVDSRSVNELGYLRLGTYPQGEFLATDIGGLKQDGG